MLAVKLREGAPKRERSAYGQAAPAEGALQKDSVVARNGANSSILLPSAKRLIRDRRQGKAEDAPLPNLAFDPHPAAQQLHQGFANR